MKLIADRHRPKFQWAEEHKKIPWRVMYRMSSPKGREALAAAPWARLEGGLLSEPGEEDQHCFHSAGNAKAKAQWWLQGGEDGDVV